MIGSGIARQGDQLSADGLRFIAKALVRIGFQGIAKGKIVIITGGQRNQHAADGLRFIAEA